MEYQDRLVCFVDLLGFGEAIKQTVGDPQLAAVFYRILGEFKSGGLERAVYGTVPVLDKGGVAPCSVEYGERILDVMDPHYELVATQFSDSFVLSAPVGNRFSCQLLIKALGVIHLQFFYGVGMLMRGGLSVGKVVHERGGALYGPAMNEAYALESKSAIYARVVASKDAEQLLEQHLAGSEVSDAFFKSFDGFSAFDLISILGAKCFKNDHEEFCAQLDRVVDDILTNVPVAYPKVAYLKTRLEQVVGE